MEKITDDTDTKVLAQKLNVGEETLKDIIKALAKPGFDPREELPVNQYLHQIEVISVDMEKGKVGFDTESR